MNERSISLPDIDSLWDYDHPEQTEAKFRNLIPEAIESGDGPYVIQLYTQLARALGLQRRFDEAHQTLDELNDALLEKGTPITRVRYLLERGRVFNSAGNPMQARNLFVKAWDIARSAGPEADFHAVDAAHMVAITEQNPDQQMLWNIKALDLAEQSRDPRVQRWMGSLYNNIGWTYMDQERYEQAHDTFEASLKFRKTQGDPELIRVAKWSIARALRSMGEVKKALKRQEVLLSEYEAVGKNSGFVYEEIGECLLSLNEPDEARPYFTKAYNELSKDETLTAERRERLRNLAQLS